MVRNLSMGRNIWAYLWSMGVLKSVELYSCVHVCVLCVCVCVALLLIFVVVVVVVWMLLLMMSSQCALSQVFSFYVKGHHLRLHVYAVRLAAAQPANRSAVERGPAANLVLVNDRLLLLLLRFVRQLELHQHVGLGVAPEGHGRPGRGLESWISRLNTRTRIPVRYLSPYASENPDVLLQWYHWRW